MKLKQLLTKTLLVAVCLLVGGVNSAWADETIFSATVTAEWSVPANTTDAEITSSYATISGGTMYVTNDQSSAKSLLATAGSKKCFSMTNSGTKFKVVLSKALQAGDKINGKTYNNSASAANRGIFLSTATSRPSSCTASLIKENAGSGVWEDLPEYTVAAGDGICGQTTFYIYRGTGNTTYFCDFTITRIPTYTITLDKNGGTSDGIATASLGQGTLTSITAPLYAGHSIEGYYKEAECTNMIANAAGVLQTSTDYTDASGKWTSESNQTLYAKWEAATYYSVDYNANGDGAGNATGTTGSVPTDANSPYVGGSTVTVLGNTGSLAKSGYTFMGWNTQADGNGTSYVAGSTFSISANTTLYAVWAENDYSFTASAGSGSISSGDEVTTSTGGKMVYTPTDGGSPTLKYSTTAGTNCIEFGGASSCNVTVTLDKKMQVGTVIGLTFYNGAETARGLKIANSEGTAKATYSETAVATFTKYYTVVAGDGLAGSKVFKIVRNNNSYLVGLTVANCAPLYTVTLDKNGGSTDGAATVSGGDNTLAISSAAERVGYYNLAGYYDAASGGNKVAEADGTLVAGVTGFTDGSGNWTATENKTLYAQWARPLPSMTKEWDIDFTSITSTSYSESTFGSTYYNLLDNTSAALNTNFGVAATENSGNNKFYIYGGALYCYYGGARNIAFNNLKVGDIVRVTCSGVPASASSGLTLLSDYSYGNVYVYQVKTAGVQTVSVYRYTYIYKVEVLHSTNEVVGALNYSTESNGEISSDITLKKGETKVVTFQNHGQDYGKNWKINVKEGETWKANVRADSWDETADAATKVSYQVSKDGGSSKVNLEWSEYQDDMADARCVATLAYGLDGTLAITTTSTGTANGYIYYVDQDVIGLTSDLTINLSVNESWLEILSIENTVVSGTITPTGWSTFASSYPLDLSTLTATSEATAYYASKATGNTVTLTPTDDVTVPAGEGIMVKGTAGETFTIDVAESGTAIDGNLLKGQTTTGYVDASNKDNNGTYHYVFGYQTSNPTVFGFYNLASDTEVAAGKAYLETTTELAAGARSLSIVFDDETTGIENLTPALSEGEGAVYNLRGQRVAQPTKGLYIVNGKKVIIK